MRHLLTLWLVAGLSAAGLFAAEPAAEPLKISGVYPSLAALSDAKSECGIGAVVPWAGSLYFLTYPAHGGDGKLYQVDDALVLHQRPESVGGTHAGRMIHRETNQLIIGPYVIDEKGGVRSFAFPWRLTAVARHLADPAGKVYCFGMEGEFVEVDLKDLKVTPCEKIQKLGVTGRHGKGGYTGEGRVVIANNGDGGALAEGDGKAWTLVEHKQFCEVTGPGGIYGAPDEKSLDTPLWATGWDQRSVILKVLDRGTWHTYRVPKSSYTHDPAHGWFTEWPRIRETEPGRFLMDFHGMLFEFPKDFRPGATAGLRPLVTHLRMLPDFCWWKGRLVLASDDTSVMGNPLGGQPQSNLWFGSWADLAKFGRPAGWGGPWVGDDAKAGAPSDPFLIDGFASRVLHLSHRAAGEVEFAVEIDAKGDGRWTRYQAVKVGPSGYAYHILPTDLKAVWARITPSADCKVSAYFHMSSPAPARTAGAEALFQGLPPAASAAPRTDGIVFPCEGKLWFLAQAADGKGGRTDAGLYEIDKDVRPRRVDDAGETAKRLKETLAGLAPGKKAAGDPVAISADDASVIIKAKGGTWRLPKADAAYDRPELAGLRQVREVVTERYLVNVAGTFYELPRGEAQSAYGPAAEGIRGIRPVATHGKIISDFCTWRGLLVMTGTLASAKPDGHYIAAEDGKAGLWFGAIDDLWQFGKPVGVGGPWKKAAVKAGEPSDPYLMTNFDKKRVELSHDAPGDVTFTVEVDFLRSGIWRSYQKIVVPAGKTVTHEFPAGFAAHWVRVTADKGCAATAWFIYE
jgi:hypothetical protein